MINPNLIIIGLLLGGTYVAISLGLSLTFGVLRLINMAHGIFVLTSAYLAYALLTHGGFDPLVSLPISVSLFFGIGYILQKKALNYLIKAASELFLIATFGIAIFLENLLLLLFTPLSRSLITSYSLGTFTFAGLNFPISYLIGFIGGVVMAVFTKLFLDKMFIGLAIKSCSQDRITSSLMGVDPDYIFAFTFGFSLSLASAAGILMGLIYPFTPTSGVTFLIISFGVIVLGGLGSITGTFVGGIILGLVQVLSGAYLGLAWSLFTGYLVILIFLLIKPEGLFRW